MIRVAASLGALALAASTAFVLPGPEAAQDVDIPQYMIVSDLLNAGPDAGHLVAFPDGAVLPVQTEYLPCLNDVERGAPYLYWEDGSMACEAYDPHGIFVNR